jgi:hypothetical protein
MPDRVVHSSTCRNEVFYPRSTQMNNGPKARESRLGEGCEMFSWLVKGQFDTSIGTGIVATPLRERP